MSRPLIVFLREFLNKINVKCGGPERKPRNHPRGEHRRRIVRKFPCDSRRRAEWRIIVAYHYGGKTHSILPAAAISLS